MHPPPVRAESTAAADGRANAWREALCRSSPVPACRALCGAASGSGPAGKWANYVIGWRPRATQCLAVAAGRASAPRSGQAHRRSTRHVSARHWQAGANHMHVGRMRPNDIGRYEPARSRRSEAMMAVLSGAAFARACASVIEPRGSSRRGVTHARRTSTTDTTMITTATSSSTTTVVHHMSRELINAGHSSFPGSGDAPPPGAIGRSIR